MVSMVVASMAACLVDYGLLTLTLTCLVDYGLAEVTSHLSLDEGPEHGVQARTGAGLAVEPRAPAAAEGALPRPRRVRLRLAPVARLMQPVAPWCAVRIECGKHGTPEAVVPSQAVVPSRRTYFSALPGQAALYLRCVRYAGGRYAHGTAAALRGFTCSGQRANVANAVGSERPRASATSSAKG